MLYGESTMGNITSPGMTDNETWNDCIRCGKEWKDTISTPGLIHRTTMCKECKNGRIVATKRKNNIFRMD